MKDASKSEVFAKRDCPKFKALILKTLPDIKEEFKIDVPWYEGKFFVVALRGHVNLGFSVKGLAKKEKTLFEGKGKMIRHVKFYSTEDIYEMKVVKLLQLVAEKGDGC